MTDDTAAQDRRLTDMTADELMALKEELAAQGVQVRNAISPDQFLLITGAIFSRDVLGALATRGTDGLVDFMRKRLGRGAHEIDVRPHARHVIDDALADWRDQSDEDMPAWMHNPDTVKELARFIRDRLVAAGIVAPPK